MKLRCTGEDAYAPRMRSTAQADASARERNLMKKSYISILGLMAVMLSCGCNKSQQEARISMAQGSLSVENLSDVDIFPTVKTAMEEDLGGVSVGGGKMVGFAQIDADKSARVLWAEKEFDEPKRTVVFPLKITEETSKQTKHLEFLYKGNGVWLLNLYGKSPPGKSAPLVSISGEVEKREVR
jgi:hypothetical protein